MALDDTWGWLTNRPGRSLSFFLTEDGTPTGNYNMTGDYSVTPKDFFIQPAVGLVYQLLGLKVFMTLKPIPSKNYYGEIVGGLTNGVSLIYQRGAYEKELLPLGPAKNNADWVIANATRINPMLDGAAELNVFEFDFRQLFSLSQPLFGEQNDRFIARLNDDFTMQTTHMIMVNGLSQALHRDQQL